MCTRFYTENDRRAKGSTNPLFDKPFKFGSEHGNILTASIRESTRPGRKGVEISISKNDDIPLQENFCNPSVSIIRLWLNETMGLGGHSNDSIEVIGTGKSFFGSGKRSVTCQDVLEAVVSESKVSPLGKCVNVNNRKSETRRSNPR